MAKDFFEDIDKWQNSFYCNECNADEQEDFTYDRSVSNGEVWICKHCGSTTMVEHMPNEDNY